MIPKVFSAICKSDIDALLENAVSEGRALEYKLTVPGRTDSAKKEFLADVSSFANAAGGDLLYGVSEKKGVPDGIPGVSIPDADAELLRLEGMIRNGVEPRIPGIEIRAITGFADGPVIVIRIRKSWASPHMVTYSGTSRFFTRSSAGKYQMDVGEIRSAFALSETLPERMKRFRDDRLGRIMADETPAPLGPNPKMVLHILPLISFSLDFQVAPEAIQAVQHKLPPISPNLKTKENTTSGHGGG